VKLFAHFKEFSASLHRIDAYFHLVLSSSIIAFLFAFTTFSFSYIQKEQLIPVTPLYFVIAGVIGILISIIFASHAL
jgi:hypothetical protein